MCRVRRCVFCVSSEPCGWPDHLVALRSLQVHGLADRAMHLYMAQAEDPLRIVRGGIFGGTLPFIECTLKAYVIALHQTLTDGYVGTEECIWAIIVKRFPHLFAPFDNNRYAKRCQ